MASLPCATTIFGLIACSRKSNESLTRCPLPSSATRSEGSAKTLVSMQRRGEADSITSQQVLARYLNVSSGAVSKWGCGEKHPAGASLKLLTLI